MRTGKGNHSYEWIENWGKIPETLSGRSNGRTHGVVVSRSGNVLVFHQANPAVIVFDADGKCLDAWGEHFLGAHGMTLVEEGGDEYLWLTDQDSAEVCKMTLDGKKKMSIPQPDHPAYKKGKYSPTWVAVNEERFGGTGDVWVADGYGMSYVHRFGRSGRYKASINGEEGKAGAFNCPHGLWFDYRKGNPELYIADRGKRRFQVYDGEGNFKRAFGADFLTSPCGAASFGDDLIVPELNARVTVLDKNDRPVCHLGENEQTCTIKGWPDHPKHLIQPGKFNSPHAAAADSKGNLYVVEWIIGGRITKLKRTP